MRPKNLLGLPWRVAFALQKDGWIVRNAIVWHKPNAMPESVRDRLNCRHELIFLLVKQPAYWFDLDPIRIPHATVRQQADCTGRRHAARTGTPPPGGTRRPEQRQRPGGGYRRPAQVRPARAARSLPRAATATAAAAGAPQRPQPRRRVVDPHPALPGTALRRVPHRHPHAMHRGRLQTGRHGPRPVLRHRHHRPCRPALGRQFTGIELNPAFAALAAERLRHAAEPEPRERHRAAAMTGRASGPFPVRPRRAPAKPPVTGRRHKPCSHPPKPRPEATIAGPRRAGPDTAPAPVRQRRSPSG